MPETKQESEPGKAEFLSPLAEYYRFLKQPMPWIDFISKDDISNPYQQLLVHDHDMTSTLEAFCHSKIHLHILKKSQKNGSYFREVILCDDANRAVEIGSIKINLGLFADKAQQLILEEQLPLGAILHRCSIKYTSCPRAFIRIMSDTVINQALKLSHPHQLYGRCNAIFDATHQTLADIIEILPPFPKFSHGDKNER